MGLYERWTASGETAADKIPVHAFGAALGELARGELSKSEVVSGFALTAEDETELDAIIATYNALPTVGAKAQGMVAFNNVMLLCESGHYPKAKAKSSLGF